MFTTFTLCLGAGCTFAAGDLTISTKDIECRALSPDPIEENAPNLLFIKPKSALPDDCYTPTGIKKLLNGSSITLPVASKLFAPEVRSRRGQAKEWASLVVVPEATMHEDHRSPARQYDIWPARQLRTVEPVAEPLVPQKLADLHFGPRVLAPDP